MHTASANLSFDGFPVLSVFEVFEVLLILSKESGQQQQP